MPPMAGAGRDGSGQVGKSTVRRAQRKRRASGVVVLLTIGGSRTDSLGARGSGTAGEISGGCAAQTDEGNGTGGQRTAHDE